MWAIPPAVVWLDRARLSVIGTRSMKGLRPRALQATCASPCHVPKTCPYVYGLMYSFSPCQRQSYPPWEQPGQLNCLYCLLSSAQLIWRELSNGGVFKQTHFSWKETYADIPTILIHFQYSVLGLPCEWACNKSSYLQLMQLLQRCPQSS